MRNEEVEVCLNVLRGYVEENDLDPEILDAFEVVIDVLSDELSYLKQSGGK